MNWLQSLIYGVISGLTEYLPVSSLAHQRILHSLFGVSQSDPICDLLVHLAVLFAVFTTCKDLLHQFRGGSVQVHNRRSQQRVQNSYSMRLVKTAFFPMIITMIILAYIRKGDVSLISVAIFSIINGILIYLPNRMLQGNKDASGMSVADSWIVGLAGSLSVLGGVSRIGATVSVATMRGADRNKALSWALILSVPALVVLCGLDFFNIVFYSGVINVLGNLLGYILAIIGSYFGAVASIMLVRYITSHTSHIWFAYYSWGVGLFSFILYLIVV